MLLNQATKGFTKYLELIDRSRETIRGNSIELKDFSNSVALKHNYPVYMEESALHNL